jgi:hypothetical protein
MIDSAMKSSYSKDAYLMQVIINSRAKNKTWAKFLLILKESDGEAEMRASRTGDKSGKGNRSPLSN